MKSVVIYGPEGCGKSLLSQDMKKHFGCTAVVDGWDGEADLPDGVLAITNVKPLVQLKDALVLSFGEAEAQLVNS